VYLRQIMADLSHDHNHAGREDTNHRHVQEDFSRQIAGREHSPVPSGSHPEELTTPTRQTSRSACHLSSVRGRSRMGTRSRQRLERVRPFPTSQLGALEVRDESFCDCPQKSQTRDLSCKCGEDDSCKFSIKENYCKTKSLKNIIHVHLFLKHLLI